MPIKVLHVITGLNTGGAEMMLYKLLSQMSSRDDMSFGVVSLRDKGTIGPAIEALGVPLHCLNTSFNLSAFTAVGRLRQVIRREKPDQIQAWLYHGNLFAQLAAIGTGIPIMWNIRQSLYSLADEKKSSAVVIRLNAMLSKYAQGMVYNSRLSRQQHEDFGFSTKGTIIPNGFDFERFKPDQAARSAIRQQLQIDDDCPVIGMVGRYHPMKDHNNFLHAASILIQQHPKIKFVLAGSNLSPDNVELMHIINELRIEDHVLLLGERSDIAELNCAFDIASLSSHTEAFPNVIGEAMSCGTPCVATDVGDVEWVLGDTGITVPPKDPVLLAKGWDSLLTMDRAERKDLGLRARKRIIEHFSLDAVASSYARLYTELCQEMRGVN